MTRNMDELGSETEDMGESMDKSAKGASLLNREMTSMKFTQWPMFYRRGTRVTF